MSTGDPIRIERLGRISADAKHFESEILEAPANFSERDALRVASTFYVRGLCGHDVAGGHRPCDFDFRSLYTPNCEAIDEIASDLQDIAEHTKLSLIGVHYRAKWLYDGRTSVASSNFQCRELLKNSLRISDLDEYFHEKLLWTYFSLHGRSLTFNERLFQIAANNTEEILQVDIAFTNRQNIHQKIIKKNNKCHVTVSIPIQNLFQDLVEPKIGSSRKREELIPLVANVANSLEMEDDDHSMQIKGNSARAELASNRVFGKLEQAVEMVCHRELASEKGPQIWGDFLNFFGFLPKNIAKDKAEIAWPTQAELAMKEAIRFLQGVCLYKPLAPGGFGTRIISLGEGKFTGLTLGVQRQGKTAKCFDIYGDTCTKTIGELIRPPKNIQKNDRKLKEILGNISDKHIKELKQIWCDEATGHDEAGLASALSLGNELRDSQHESEELQFQFVFGNIHHLRRFREIYVLTNEETDRFFDVLKPKEQAKLLEAHYSYLQEPTVALFIDTHRRIYPRVIDVSRATESIQFNSSTPSASSSSLTEIAELITKDEDYLIYMITGRGRVSVYTQGEVVLQSPASNGDFWGVPSADTKSYRGRDPIKSLLLNYFATSDENNLGENEARYLAETLLWIADSPGLGCTLLLVSNIDNIRNYHSALNPYKWKWLQNVNLAGLGCDFLRNMLIQDGATVLSLNNGNLNGQFHLVPMGGDGNNPVALGTRDIIFSSDHMNNAEENGGTNDTTGISHGARHTAARYMTSKELSGKVECAIVVSETGRISVFKGGELVKP